MELTPNAVYRVNHSSGMIRWRFIRLDKWPAIPGSLFRASKRYIGVNLATGREIQLKSTRKIKGPDSA